MPAIIIAGTGVFKRNENQLNYGKSIKNVTNMHVIASLVLYRHLHWLIELTKLSFLWVILCLLNNDNLFL